MSNRRRFLQTIAATGLSVRAFAAEKPVVSPNEKLNFAAVGVGGRGFADVKGMVKSGQVNVTAAADVDEVRSEGFRRMFPQAKFYKDWRELLSQEGDKLDLISVATPDHMHAPVALEAMQMGIPVYGEKPLAHTLKETRRIAELSRRQGLATQMGSQYTTSMHERIAVRAIKDGAIGKVKEVHTFCHKTWGDPKPLPRRNDPVPPSLEWDFWLGVAQPRPYIGEKYYTPGNWRKRLDFGTGTLGDMGCHILSPVFRALDVRNPLSVKSVGAKPNATNWAVDESVEYVFSGTHMTEGETLTVTWCDGQLRPPQQIVDVFGEGMAKQGAVFVGTDGYILVPFRGESVLYPRDKYSDFRFPELPARDHFNDFIAAVKGEGVKPLADFHVHGGPLTEIVLLGALSTHFPNELLQWDANSLRIKNHGDANKLVTKSYREGWEIRDV